MTPETALAEPVAQPNSPTTDEWLTIAEAAELSGIGKDTLVHRMTKPTKGSNRFFQPHEFRKNPAGRGMEVLRSAVLRQPAVTATSSKGQARPDITVRNQLKRELGRMPSREEVAVAMGGSYILTKAAAKRAEKLRRVTKVAEPAAPPDPMVAHTAYAAGHCTAWVEVYAVSQDIPAKALIAGVVAVLRGGGK